jgi:hypothetical protein
MKSISIYDFFYCVTFNTVGPLFETISGNKYVLVAIDHYSKWGETLLVKEHDVFTATKFLEDEIIYKYGVLKFIMINNGNEWMKEFIEICCNYGKTHQFIAPT